MGLWQVMLVEAGVHRPFCELAGVPEVVHAGMLKCCLCSEG